MDVTPGTAPLETPPGPLVTGTWLESNLGEGRVLVLDVRGRHPSSPLAHAKRAEYIEGHVPGAIFVDWEHDFVDVSDPVPYQVASPDAFAARASELGIGDRDLVVTYDDYYGIFASRVAWSFRLYGADARVLDGGWRTWVEDGRPTTAAAVDRDAAPFTARVRARRDYRDEKRAFLDPATDRCVPSIAPTKLALVKPHFETCLAQRVPNAHGGVRILRSVADEHSRQFSRLRRVWSLRSFWYGAVGHARALGCRSP